jgi:phosphatidate cytidylyltransferase
MLGWRLAMSALLIPALIGIFYLDARAGASAPYLLAFAVLLAMRGAAEMVWLLRTRSFQPHLEVVSGGCVLVVAASWYGRLGLAPVAIGPAGDTLTAVLMTYALVILVLFTLAAARYREPGRNLETLAAEILIVSYIGVLIGVTAQLRWVAGADAGYLVLGSLVLVTKMGDVGAYTLGRLFGRRKMVPRLSPGKTWMGGLGALLGSGLAALVWLQFATPLFHPAWQPCRWYWAVLYGVIVGVAGIIGDLCESLIKRDVGQKDSAPLMPGFGGLLDLIDSVIFAGPVAWLLWKILPLATWL